MKEMGLEAVHTRAEGIITDPDRLGKVKAWLHHDLCNTTGEQVYGATISGDDVSSLDGDKYVHPQVHGIVDALDRATVRGHATHGPTRLREDGPYPLPLVCIGDSLRNIGTNDQIPPSVSVV